MKNQVFYFIFLLFFFSRMTFGQTEEIEAYRKKMQTVKADSSLVKMYNSLSWKLVNVGLFDEAYEASKKAEEIFNRLPDKIRQMNSTRITSGYVRMGFGIVYKMKRDYSSALKEFGKGLEIMKSVSNYDGVSRMYVNLSGLFIEMGKYPEALKYQLENLDYKRKLGDKKGEYTQFNEIGVTYLYSQQYEKALTYFLDARKGAKELKDSSILSISLDNIGNIYQLMGKFDEACIYYNEGLHIDSLRGEILTLSRSLLNTGLAYVSKRELKRGDKLLTEALGLSRQLNDFKAMSAAKLGLASIATLKKDYVKGKELARGALMDAQAAKSNEYVRSCYKSLSDLDSASGDYRSAFLNYKISVRYYDSLINERNMVDIARSEMKYDFRQKEDAARIEQEKKELIAQQEKSRQSIIRNAFIGGFALFFFLAIVMYRSYLNKKRANTIISKQKEEVSRQNELLEFKNNIIEEKQKEILDSIRYAKRIQTSIMPMEKYFEKTLKRLSQ